MLEKGVGKDRQYKKKKRLIFDFGFDFETILVVQETVII